METRKFKQVPSISSIGNRNPNIPKPVVVSYGKKKVDNERIITKSMRSDSRTISAGRPIDWNEVWQLM